MATVLIRSELMTLPELKDTLAGLSDDVIRWETQPDDFRHRAVGFASPEVLAAVIGAGGAAFGTALTLLVQGIWRRIDQRIARQAQTEAHRLARETTLIELRSGEESIQIPMTATEAEFEQILSRVARLREAQALIIRSA